ncbi:MAG: S1C family serine protease [Lachnospiraceae bacterium]
MPERNDPGKNREKRQFIKEKIVKQPLTKRQLASRLLAFFFIAVMFGVVAAVSFAVSRPIAVRYLGGETYPTEASISIPKDEPSESITESSETVMSSEESEPLEKVVQSAVEQYRYSMDDVDSLSSVLRNLAQGADKGIVLVHSVQQDVDWFDNPVETTGLYAGAVIASTRRELLILTPEAAVGKADSIKVMFVDGTEVDGRMKQKDKMYGMAIVSVDINSVEESTWNTVTTLSLGNSYTMKQGDFVVAVGGPAGVVHSIDYGIISYIMKNVQVLDGIGRALYVNVDADVETGTFLINSSGELVGWVSDKFPGEENSTSMSQVFGISDYKVTLERLTNGLGVPYFGILGQEVGEIPTSSVLPEGLYVQNVEIDSPAYNGGIQNGDIITGMNDEPIVTMKDFQMVMEGLECGQLINVTVQRYGRDQYTQLDFQITIGTR